MEAEIVISIWEGELHIDNWRYGGLTECGEPFLEPGGVDVIAAELANAGIQTSSSTETAPFLLGRAQEIE
jgi:hypothetical protein